MPEHDDTPAKGERVVYESRVLNVTRDDRTRTILLRTFQQGPAVVMTPLEAQRLAAALLTAGSNEEYAVWHKVST